LGQRITIIDAFIITVAGRAGIGHIGYRADKADKFDTLIQPPAAENIRPIGIEKSCGAETEKAQAVWRACSTEV
jgi:hypothetical protein